MSSQNKNRIRSMGVLPKCCGSKHTADGVADPRCRVQWKSRHLKQRSYRIIKVGKDL